MKKEESFGIIPIFLNEKGTITFLLVQHATGHWAFPKGHAHMGETEHMTALRELQEETGVSTATIVPHDPIKESYIYTFQKERRDKTVSYYIAQCADQKLTLNPKEISNAGWFTYEEAKKRITFDESKQTLESAKNILNSISVHASK